MSLPTLLPDHSSYMNTRPEQPLLHTDFKVLAPDRRKPLYPISWQERIYSGQEFYAASNTAVRNFISMGMLCQQIASECSIKCMYNMFISLQCMGYDSHGHRGNKIGPYIYHIILDVYYTYLEMKKQTRSRCVWFTWHSKDDGVLRYELKQTFLFDIFPKWYRYSGQ